MAKGKIQRKIIAGGLTVCFTFCMQFIFSQTLQTITDKKDILIGEQIKITLKSPMDGLTKWIVLPDSIPHFEIVETGKPDTTNFKDDSKAIEQTITFTSFDSGRWTFRHCLLSLPELPVRLHK